MNNTYIKLLCICLLLVCNSKIKAQNIQTTSITSSNRNSHKVSATVNVKYRSVNESSTSVFFHLAADISINPDEGYNYHGKIYTGYQIKELQKLLQEAGANYPTVTFDIYYKSLYKSTQSYSITNGTFHEGIEVKCTEQEAADPAGWTLRAKSLDNFNFSEPTIWMTMEDVIRDYEKEKRQKDEYDQLIRDADMLYNRKDFIASQDKYIKANGYSMADSYPGKQIQKIKGILLSSENESKYKQMMEAGQQAENNQQYPLALSIYNSASNLGINNSQALSAASNVKEKINALKKEQEEKQLLQQKLDDENKTKIKQEQLKVDEDQLELKKKEEEIESFRKKTEDELKKKLNDDERQKAENEIKEKLKAEEESKKRLEEQNKLKEKNEKARRKKELNNLIEKAESNMSYDPIEYGIAMERANDTYNKAMEIDPSKALNLKQDWWNINSFMKDMADDLDEPKRKAAWNDYQDRLAQSELYFADAKYDYIEALKYVDRGSKEQRDLKWKIEWCDINEEIWKQKFHESFEQFEQQKKDREWAKGIAEMNRINDNRYKAKAAYSILTDDYMYPNVNSKVRGSENALQRQMDFEKRLNEADQQAKVNNAIAGVSTQIVSDLMSDQSKYVQAFQSDDMGINAFLFSGFVSVPTIMNVTSNLSADHTESGSAIIFPPLYAGLDIWLHRGKIWDLCLSPSAMFGICAVSKGTQNQLFMGGATLKTAFGIKRVKLAFEGSWFTRSGEAHSDYDVSTANDPNYVPIPGSQPTGEIHQSQFNYSVVKVGTGLHINTSDKESESYLRLLVYAEKISFYQNFNLKNPVISFGIEWLFKSGITISGNYSDNYPQTGDGKFAITKYKQVPYIEFKIGKTFTLAKLK